MGSNSGGSSSTQEFKPPWYTTQYGQTGLGPWQDYVAQAAMLASAPYTPYTGQTVADISPQQQMAMDLIQQRAVNGAPDLNAARGMATQVSQGQYLGNPYLPNQYLANGNPYVSSTYLAGQQNPYLTEAYTNEAISRNTDAMARAAQLGTMAQTDAMFARGGGFGGSAYEQQQGINAANLENQVGNMANQLRLQQMGMGVNDYRNQVGQQLQQMGMNIGDYRNQVGQQLQQLGIGVNDYRNATQQMLGGGALAGNLSQDDWQAAQMLMGSGDAQRQYIQDLLNSSLQAFNQRQMYPYQQLDMFGNALARASGNVAGGSTQTAYQSPYQTNPYSSYLGLGLAGLGAYYGSRP